MFITSKDNSNIKLCQKILSSKKERNEHNLFFLEGMRIFEDALIEKLEIEKVFVTKSFTEKFTEFYNEILYKLDNNIIFEISDELGQKLSDTKAPQGIFALVKKIERKFTPEHIKKTNKYLVLNNLQDPGNIGTIIRTADAVGIDGIFMTSDCCELFNPKLVRSTMGSLFRMDIFEGFTILEIVEIFKENKIKTYSAVIDSGAVSVTECDFSEGGLVVIGNEGNGLPKEIAELTDFKLSIKMKGNVNSLNAAMASGIIMWEMTK